MLEAAIDKSLEEYNVLRGEILEHAQEVAIRSKAQYEIKTSNLRRLARMITENMGRSKKDSERKCLNKLINEKQKRLPEELN